MRHLGFNQKDIYALGRHGIKSAFLDSTETRELLNEFDAYVNHNSHDTKV
jgi:adenosine deaminase